MKKWLVIVLWAAGNCFMPANAHAVKEDLIPYQLAIVYPVQVVNEHKSIKGVRLNLLYGVNEDVSGFDFGSINQVNGTQTGLQLGIFNNSFKTSGVQIGFFNKTEFLSGLQIGLLNFHAHGSFKVLPIVNFKF